MSFGSQNGKTLSVLSWIFKYFRNVPIPEIQNWTANGFTSAIAELVKTLKIVSHFYLQFHIIIYYFRDATHIDNKFSL
jgi:hypothetical protein